MFPNTKYFPRNHRGYILRLKQPYEPVPNVAHTPAAWVPAVSVTTAELETRWVSEQAGSSSKLCFENTVAIRKEFFFYVYIVLLFSLLLLPVFESGPHSIAGSGQGS